MNSCDKYENSANENSIVKFSLSQESAAMVRIARKIKSVSNPALSTNLRGFYDGMTGQQSIAESFNSRLQVSYEQGLKKAKSKREALKGGKWYETEIAKDGKTWLWSVYCEGVFIASGKESSQLKAEIESFEARFTNKFV